MEAVSVSHGHHHLLSPFVDTFGYFRILEIAELRYGRGLDSRVSTWRLTSHKSPENQEHLQTWGKKYPFIRLNY